MAGGTAAMWRDKRFPSGGSWEGAGGHSTPVLGLQWQHRFTSDHVAARGAGGGLGSVDIKAMVRAGDFPKPPPLGSLAELASPLQSAPQPLPRSQSEVPISPGPRRDLRFPSGAETTQTMPVLGREWRLSTTQEHSRSRGAGGSVQCTSVRDMLAAGVSTKRQGEQVMINWVGYKDTDVMRKLTKAAAMSTAAAGQWNAASSCPDLRSALNSEDGQRTSPHLPKGIRRAGVPSTLVARKIKPWYIE